MSSWTQVYISGLSKSINPSDEEIEDYLNKCYSLDGVGNDNHNNNDDDHDGESGEHVNSSDQDGNTSSNSSVTNNLMWAGPGSTLIKRDDNGCCRGFAFLTFYSMDGALLAIDRINNDSRRSSISDAIASSNNMILRAELSNPTSSKKKGGKKKKNDDGENLTDLRLRRQRKQPVRKHPVITSSDGKRTNLGNKTK
ncbi:hypothetical protein ACHAWC_009623 [Mediolabrus comicus]